MKSAKLRELTFKNRNQSRGDKANRRGSQFLQTLRDQSGPPALPGGVGSSGGAGKDGPVGSPHTLGRHWQGPCRGEGGPGLRLRRTGRSSPAGSACQKPHSSQESQATQEENHPVLDQDVSPQVCAGMPLNQWSMGQARGLSQQTGAN